MRGAIHSLKIRSRTPTVDIEGQTSYSNSDTTVQGRVHIANSNDIDMGKQSYQADAIAWLPLATTVSDDDQIVVSGLHSLLNGTYDITSIQHTQSHQRVFLLGANT